MSNNRSSLTRVSSSGSETLNSNIPVNAGVQNRVSNDSGMRFDDKDEQCRADSYFRYFEDHPRDLLYLAVHDFRRLQMMNIYYYQREIELMYPEDQIRSCCDKILKLRPLLEKYSQALRDYEYAVQLPKPSRTKAHTQRCYLQNVSQETTKCINFNDHRIIRGSPSGFIERMFTNDASGATGNRNLDEQQRSSRCHNLFSFLEFDIIRRICVGTLIGAPFVLVPMIILQFCTNEAWRLSTVSVAVVLFSVFLGFCSNQSNGEHLASVAAYAAVMVVFIGTTAPTEMRLGY